MFGNKERDKRIRQLEKEVAKLNWLIENPCPWNIGQKIKVHGGTEIISDITLFEDKYYGGWYFRWEKKSVKPIKK